MNIVSRIWIIGFLLMSLNINAQESALKQILAGAYTPLYGTKTEIVKVEAFQMDEYPVTNGQYLTFIKQNPKWRRSKVIQLFADDNYLIKWKNDTTYSGNIHAPVTTVSWFAAKAYCETQDKRLPTMNEWEYVALASEHKANAQSDSLFNNRILKGYETPRTYLKNVGSTFKNYWGIHDIHGLVWEWTIDFNSVLISGESRQDGDTERNLFCAGGAVNATDLMNYAAFMRYAFRGSIKANYCIQNLGFRCAKDDD